MKRLILTTDSSAPHRDRQWPEPDIAQARHANRAGGTRRFSPSQSEPPLVGRDWIDRRAALALGQRDPFAGRAL